MAMKFFCDRCKKEIKPEHYIEQPVVLPKEVRPIYGIGKQRFAILSENYELCKGCIEEIIEWFKNPEPKDKKK